MQSRRLQPNSQSLDRAVHVLRHLPAPKGPPGEVVQTLLRDLHSLQVEPPELHGGGLAAAPGAWKLCVAALVLTALTSIAWVWLDSMPENLALAGALEKLRAAHTLAYKLTTRRKDAPDIVQAVMRWEDTPAARWLKEREKGASPDE